VSESRQLVGVRSAAGLVEALDRLVAEGVTVTGDVIIGVAGVDLIRLDLRALLVGVSEPREATP
jgi:ABC-type thiamine transport system substrate-binding protein